MGAHPGQRLDKYWFRWSLVVGEEKHLTFSAEVRVKRTSQGCCCCYIRAFSKVGPLPAVLAAASVAAACRCMPAQCAFQGGGIAAQERLLLVELPPFKWGPLAAPSAAQEQRAAPRMHWQLYASSSYASPSSSAVASWYCSRGRDGQAGRSMSGACGRVGGRRGKGTSGICRRRYMQGQAVQQVQGGLHLIPSLGPCRHTELNFPGRAWREAPPLHRLFKPPPFTAPSLPAGTRTPGRSCCSLPR